jgi:hypothetical protein
LVQFNDGIYSPAGPKNHALSQSEAEYITFIDSDDYLEPGTLDAWLATARATGASAVVAPIRTVSGGILATPRIRPSKPQILDPVRDGLAARSLPHGLLRRAKLQEIQFRYTQGLRVGEDLEPTLRLFFTGGRIAYPYGSPAYCQTDDAGQGRVTAAIAPLEDELAWFAPLAEQEWIGRASKAQRIAIGTQLMRVHGIGALRRRGELASTAPLGNMAGRPSTDSLWNAQESAAWRAFYLGVKELTGDGLGALSIRDKRLAQAASAANDAAELALAMQNYRSSAQWEVMITQRPHLALGRNSIIRHYVNEKRRRGAAIFAAPHPSESPQ